MNDQEFWESVAVPVTRTLVQAALTKNEVATSIANNKKTIAEFSTELAAAIADLLLSERNKRMPGHPTHKSDSTS
jgi:hypothetical protein